MNHKAFIYFWCSVVFVTLFSGNALAHKVTVFAWVEGDTVFGETKFSGGKRAKNAEIIVWDKSGNELLRTRTEENGEFSFQIPKKCAMRIELIAGMGHKGEWTIPLEEIGEIGEAAATDNSVSEKNRDEAKQESEAPSLVQVEKPTSQEAQVPFLNKAELEAIVEKSVEKSLNKKITPLIKMMADLEQKDPSFSEIAGGIGYIFGLMGLALYFKSRKKLG
ncbi:hypothetical protein [Desulfospira joergensenii]|uniref:hypothetical protein n=1 Tax=Desulfospira joergensenii TaxID=53329 RepID=UPI0003B71B02|nr:hypothetical protein [Desulfospira joergensenii]